MNSLEEKIKSVLVKTVPLPPDSARNWSDVVRRAEAPARERRSAQAKRSVRSYVARRLVPVVVLVAVIFSFVLIAPWQHGPGPAVIQRALAAIGDGPVLHAVLHYDMLPNMSYVDLSTGRRTPILQTTELWYDRERRFGYEKAGFEINGVFTPEIEILVTPEGIWTSAGRVEQEQSGLPPQLTGFFDHYRSALKDGSARVTGSGTLNGRAVTWIEWASEPVSCPSDTAHSGEICTERVAVDKASSLPLQIAWLHGSEVAGTIGIASIETLPAGSGDFPKPKEIPQHSYSIVPMHVASIVLPAVVEALPTALWLGDNFSSLELTGTSRVTLRLQDQSTGSAPVTATAIELHYGAGETDSLWSNDWSTPAPNADGIVIHEQKADPEFPGGVGSYPAAPAGSMLTGDRQGWLVENGTYVQISASSEELLLAAARALTPIQP